MLGGVKVRASFIFIPPKGESQLKIKKKKQKAAKIKYSPAHAFTPGEGLREETSSCRYFLHCSDSIMIKKCHKVEQHREQNLFGLQSVWRICQGWYLPSVREVESVSCYCNLQSVTSCIPAAVRERCLRRVAFSPPPAYPLAEVLYLHSCTDFWTEGTQTFLLFWSVVKVVRSSKPANWHLWGMFWSNAEQGPWCLGENAGAGMKVPWIVTYYKKQTFQQNQIAM